jgi:molybdate transport system substrate-binding protein
MEDAGEEAPLRMCGSVQTRIIPPTKLSVAAGHRGLPEPMMTSPVAAFAGTVFLWACLLAAPIHAAEIKVISSPPVSLTFRDLGPQFEHSTGHTLLVDYANIAALKQRIAAGETFDVAIVSPKLIDELLQEGKIAAGTRLNLGRTGLGVVTRKGAPRPDIGSVDAFRRALLGASAVAYSATGESGIGFLSVLDRLGIAAEMKPKIKPSGNLTNVVETGEAEFGVTGIGAALANTKLDYAGAFPSAIQAYVNLAAGVSASAKEPEAARALLKYLGDPSVVQVMRSKGLEPY